MCTVYIYIYIYTHNVCVIDKELYKLSQIENTHVLSSQIKRQSIINTLKAPLCLTHFLAPPSRILIANNID